MAGRKASSPKPSKKPAAARKATAASDALAPLTGPEKHLIDCVKRDEPCRFNKSLPVKEWTIRALVIERLMREQPLAGSKLPLKLPAKGLVIQFARIEGQLDLEYCVSSTPLSHFGCDFPEEIVLRDARLRTLHLIDCHLHGISGDRLRLEGPLSLRKSKNRGQICLNGATVEGGQLALSGATLKNVDKDGAAAGVALFLQRATFGGNVFLDEKFSAKGEVRMNGATVAGQLSLSSAKLRNTDKDGAAAGNALSLDVAKIGGNVFLEKGFSAKGEVRMLGATVAGQLSVSSAKLRNTDKDGAAAGDALSLDRAKIGGSVFLNKEFSAKGGVRMLGATINGDLVLEDAVLESTGKDGRVVGPSLSLQKATVKGGCIFRGLKDHSLGDVELTAAVLAEIIDDGSLWPQCGNGHLLLDGLVYDRFVASPGDWRTRKAWLMRQPPQHLGVDFTPHPWVQCAKVLREMGHDHDARMLLFHMHEAWRDGLNLRKRSVLSWSFWRGLWTWLKSQGLRWTVGHGYRPWRVMVWIAGTVLFGWAIFWCAHANERMTPAKERFFLDQTAFEAYQESGVLPQGYPEFSPLIYSLDVFLPIVSFGQEDHWRPANLDWRWWNAWSWNLWKPWTWNLNWIRFYNRLHIVLGWFFTSIAVLAFTGIIKRD